MDIEDISSTINFQSSENSNESNDSNDSNESNEELFHSYIDRSIETGNVKFIQFAIQEFTNKINISYINFANTILMQLIEEQIQDMEL